MAENKTNLIVNYLPQSLSDEEFRGMFLSIGPLQGSKIVRDRTTGYSYGFGFVNFVNSEDAMKAIGTLNGLQLQNKTIKVALSREGRDVKNANLYVRNLPQGYTKDDLHQAFSSFGKIIQTRVLVDQGTGMSKCVGFVLYDNKDEADKAIVGMDGTTLPGASEPLSVRHAEDNRGKARPVMVLGGGGGGRGGGGGYNDHASQNFGTYGQQNFGGYQGGGGYGPIRGRGMGNQRFNPMAGGNGPYGNGGMGGGSMYASCNNNAMGGGMGDGPTGGHVLFVYNIGTDADERTLWQLFSPFGAVQKVNVIKDYQKNQCKGYGFVTMTNYNDCLCAIQNLNGYRHNGKALQVSFKTQK